ncbi:hypothetical protein C0992_003118 [Termitomyces sp. T32_za158]|nr:hypothetical protein C0992_003118 [Termitomyces sp. T32_za158]
MMLVQKPPSFNLNHSPLRHRRHPSSPPIVLVQPTPTPGLLTINRPPPKPQQRSPRPQQPLRTKVAPTTPTPPPRARPTKDKSATPPSSRSTPSQAEGPSDPFLIPSHSSKPRNNRKRQPVSIPVQLPSPPSQPPAARSVPLPRHRPAKRNVAPEPLLPAFNFPICDDMSDNDNTFDAPAPVTPTRPKQQQHRSSLPHKPQPSPAQVNKSRPRNHKRAPSDSGMVFHMSSDESGPETASDEVNALFNKLSLARKSMTTPPPAQRERMYEAMAQREVRGYFASSSFQNSPSPEELPDPEFI